MCGLVGMFGNVNLTHGKMFGDMLLMDTLRGKDSTGVVFVPIKSYTAGVVNTPIVEKELGLPDNLWCWNHSKIFDTKGHVYRCPRVLMGHNRAATLGKVITENAHPFVFGSIYGAHNGSLRDWGDLENASEHDVDSKAIFDHIATHGIEDTWKKFLGAAALTWWDDDKETFNIIRNTERPLLLAFTEDEKVAFYASEEWMIVESARRRNIKLKTEKDEKTGQEIPYIRRFEEHYHYEYEVTNSNFKLIRREKLEKKTLPPVKANTKNGGTNTSSATAKTGGTTITYPVGSGRKAKGNKQINKFWAANMDKAGKDTRGVFFTITSVLEGGLKFIAKIDGWGPKHILTIYPDSWEEAEQIKDDFYIGRRSYRTDSRLRVSQKLHFSSYGVSSRGISRVINTPTNTSSMIPGNKKDKDDSPKVLPLSQKVRELKGDVPEDNHVSTEVYRGPNGVWVDEDTWKKWASECTNGSTCVYCGDPLDINDHKEILWLDEKNCLCPICSTSPMAVNSMSELFPHLGQLA